MTERRLTEAVVGLAGRLSHIPYGSGKTEDHGWYSSRNFARDAPVFRALGPYKAWLPAETDATSDSLPTTGASWDRNRKQKRWLLKSHPEASLGNQLLEDLFYEDDSALASQDDRSLRSCLFSFGELTDTSPGRAPGAPLVVTVTGSANNILRLTRLDQDAWTWAKNYPVAVRLSELSREKPALWIEEDVGPIRRVKCLVDLKRYNPTRWLAVQRDAGTTILQPEYRAVQTDGNIERNGSRIAGNPLFHLTKDQTGGAAHSDVSFNPSTRSKPPQISIVDERGFWSVWDVTHTRFRPSGEPMCRLKICGHITRGVIDQLPDPDHSNTQWHKLLWVGRSEDDLDILGSLDLGADTEESGTQPAFPPLHRSSFLLVCNSQQVRLFDLATGIHLPDLVFIRQDGRDCVLDVQKSHDPQYFYVLTSTKLFIVRAYSKPGIEWDKPEKLWTILFSTPHFRSCFDQSLQLGICQGAKSVQPTSLVFIYSSTNPWIDLFSVELSTKDPNAVRCQPNIAGLGSFHNVINSPVRGMWVTPAPVTFKTRGSPGSAMRDLAEQRIRVYQVFLMKPDRSIVSFLCLSSLSPSVHIVPPTIRFSRRPRAERQRRTIPHSVSNFVVPDDSPIASDSYPGVTQRFVKVFYERLCNVIAKPAEAAPSNRQLVVQNPFEAVRIYVEDALDKGLIPLRTLYELMPKFRDISPDTISRMAWETEVANLDNIHLTVVVHKFGLLRSFLGLPPSAPLHDAYIRLLEIVKSSFHSRSDDRLDGDDIARIEREIGYDLYVSVYGIGFYKPPNHPPRTPVEDEDFPYSQADTLPSSPPRLSSPPSAPAWSQLSDTEVADEEDPAMTLIRSYTGSGKFVPNKRFELLDKWELGAEPSSYVFDLDRSGDAEAARQRRAKQLAREDRKRRRAETLFHLSQEPDLPATQPAPDIRFQSSQPKGFSSQRQILHSDPLQTMSQPVGGVFGRRPTKKAKKRKGGF